MRTHRSRRPAIALAVVIALPVIVSAEEDASSPQGDRQEVLLDLSTRPMLRNAGLAVAGVESASRAMELAARPLLAGVRERRDGWGIASRAAWVLWIDMPIWSLGQTLNHEYGHVLREPPDATPAHVTVKVSLPLLTVDGSTNAQYPRTPTPGELLSMQSGGWEADWLALHSTRSALYGSEKMHFADALAYSLSKTYTTAYLLRGTSARRLNPRTEEDWHSDVPQYARWLSEIEEGPKYSLTGFQARARAMRRGAYWNLADYTLWATTLGWLKGHIVDGKSTLPTPWLNLGSIALAPSLSYTLTPIGPERSVLTGLRVGRLSADVSVRWTDPVQGRRLVGAGTVYRLGRSGALLQTVAVDAWRNPAASLSGRVEVGGEWRRSSESRIGLRWALGAKGRGYLAGFSDSPHAYAAFGLRALF